jgi:hypothetical protein
MVPTRFYVPGGWRIMADYGTDTERDLGFERTLDWAKQRAERDWLKPVKTWHPRWGYDVDPAFRDMCKVKNWDDNDATLIAEPAPTSTPASSSKLAWKTRKRGEHQQYRAFISTNAHPVYEITKSRKGDLIITNETSTIGRARTSTEAAHWVQVLGLESAPTPSPASSPLPADEDLAPIVTTEDIERDRAAGDVREAPDAEADRKDIAARDRAMTMH